MKIKEIIESDGIRYLNINALTKEEKYKHASYRNGNAVSTPNGIFVKTGCPTYGTNQSFSAYAYIHIDDEDKFREYVEKIRTDGGLS